MTGRWTRFAIACLIFATGFSAALAQTVTLRFAAQGVTAEQLPVYKQMIADFEDANPGVKVDLQQVAYSESHQKFVTQAGAGSLPDVAYLQARYIPEFVERGVLQPLTDYASQDFLSNYFDSALQSMYWKKTLYGIPWAFSTKVLVYRPDLLKKAGIDGPPTTWDQLLADAQAINDPPNVYAIGLVGCSGLHLAAQWFQYFWQAGGTVYKSDGTYNFDSPEAIKATQFYTDLYTKYKVTEPGVTSVCRNDAEDMFSAGNIGMMITGPWIRNKVTSGGQGVPYAVAQEPADVKTANLATTDALVIFNTTKHPDLAWKLIQAVSADKLRHDYSVAAGFVPVKKTVAAMPPFSTDEFWQAFTTAAKHAVARPTTPYFTQIQNDLVDAVQSVLLGQQTAEKAMKQLNQQANNTLQ